MRILLVAGFLGSGKTRFIMELIKDIDGKVVILENERGTANIDSQRLAEEAHDDIEVRALSEGCVCCTMKADFTMSVMTIAQNFAPDYLVVEASGVAKLGKLIENIESLPPLKDSLLPPLLLLDAVNLKQSQERYPKSFQEQVANAGRILLSKLEQLSPEERQERFALLKALRPELSIEQRPYLHLGRPFLDSLLAGLHESSTLLDTGKDSPPDTLSLEGCTLEDLPSLLAFLDGLVVGAFGKIERAKGAFLVGQSPIRFDTVGDRYTFTGASAKEVESGPVFIAGRSLRQGRLKAVLKASGASFQPGLQLF